MVKKTTFSDLVEAPVEIAPDQKACANCAHGRERTNSQTNQPYILCKKGPPSVLVEPMPASQSLAIRNRWPAMGLDEECDAFAVKS